MRQQFSAQHHFWLQTSSFVFSAKYPLGIADGFCKGELWYQSYYSENFKLRYNLRKRKYFCKQVLFISGNRTDTVAYCVDYGALETWKAINLKSVPKFLSSKYIEIR